MIVSCPELKIIVDVDRIQLSEYGENKRRIEGYCGNERAFTLPRTFEYDEAPELFSAIALAVATASMKNSVTELDSKFLKKQFESE